jgi:glycosyltransferase involved in cell wall biosynthesis
MLDLRKTCEQVRIVKFRRNYGQTAAMAAGFDVSRGEVVVTLDGDLQNDPGDIPRLVEELQRGYDMVAGWRKERHDGFVLRRLPSVVANRLIAVVSGVRIHDTGCTLKAFRRELVKNMPIYAEQHRFLPLMSSGSGARVSELVVHHRPRRFGRSKYGLGRATRVLLDLFTVKLIAQFSQRPLQYFGLLALLFLFGAAVVAVVGLVEFGAEDSLLGVSLARDWELVVASVIVLLTTLVVYFGLLGLLAELTVKASGMHRRGVLDRILNELH